ncbi:Cellulose synthase/poly-beta-1,6-N-acetylglucosamine synthase-like glycosyltransferase [Vibrio crassostreae]|uniref:glycosyltransferase n=1 Tax=Vibrio crassostreae TaxID=246167 RepID=UPI001046CF9D|nr:glycosyltransferase family 2 protein [Vibrio crassostreae]TCN76905.1 cellulose synthase/poly-beta-1,6-N-acetylglucosamine synthase-like glycosyltransferase [Vibrio crassostreae]CAK2509905.1 Cellulose synthase/poly-beta-1,6-N-acetylglucosamine synthase-like glycosyltransferase [Vibrio crassostreae]CAK2520653.1 Cellulose synthase/poly-beta-1,6-N-acetylglucosamine synthase-like glycosyltransferase [Vibrio crassostreae]CAK3859379.1 Cellulose synthase/poly-beta-1,6-N-acetylglucosamine synthase-li
MENIFTLPIYLNLIFLLFLAPWLFKFREVINLDTRRKNVTFIIPTYNDGLDLIKTLHSIENINTKHKIDVLVIDDASTDDTTSEYNNWTKNNKNRFKYEYLNTKINTGLKSKAVSYAIPYINSICDVIVIIDGDTILTPESLDIAISELYNDKNIGAVCGAVLPYKSRCSSIVDFLQYFEMIGAFHGIKLAQSNMDSTASLAGAFTVHKKKAIDDVGWFNDWLVEDICWTWKARAKGWKLLYSPNAIAYTSCPTSIKTLWMQRTRWSRGRVEALKVAYKENEIRFFSILPWFLYSIVQAIWIPFFVISLVINTENTILLFLATFILHWIFASVNMRKNKLSESLIFQPFCSAIWTSFLVDLLLFIPNTKGLLLESFGAKKKWLTR